MGGGGDPINDCDLQIVPTKNGCRSRGGLVTSDDGEGVEVFRTGPSSQNPNNLVVIFFTHVHT